MVGPISEAERSAFNRRATAAVTLLVGVSSALVAVQADAALPEAAGIGAVGLVVGYVIAWYVVPSGPAPAARQRRRRETQGPENPFADGGQNDEDSGERGSRGKDDERDSRGKDDERDSRGGTSGRDSESDSGRRR